MISKDSIESAYCFFHQKWNIYAKSSIDWQKDDIEYAIDQYTIEMNQELYRLLAHGNEHFLRDHQTFAQDISSAVEELENML